MLEATTNALAGMFACPCIGGFLPEPIGFLVLGVVIGLVIGVIPGLGGLAGLVILIPFTPDLQTGSAVALLLGMLSATTASDSIPAVLFAVPGTAGAQATILDGHPMAKRGEAGRALGAAYSAQVLGGLVAALLLAVSVPILRPLVLFLGSPEFFMLGVLGISMVATLSTGATIKGLAAASLGILIAMVGRDPVLGSLRWHFDVLYLFDGIPLAPLAIGLFALPEIAGILGSRSRISNVPAAKGGLLAGVKDTLVNWRLTLRCSALGAWLGAIPGMGLAVIDWLAYGHALQTVRGASTSFGKGDVRGVIAPESAINAKDAGAFIPTLAFGIPGSASMAVILGAFLMQGVRPGPDLLNENLEFVYLVIWTLVLGNIIGCAIVLAASGRMARLAQVDIQVLVPIIIVAVFLAAFQASRSSLDFLVLVVSGLLGWLMKQTGWPRPPLLLAFVLGPILERYYFISTQAYGWAWTTRPIVIGLLIVTIAGLVYGLKVDRNAVKRQQHGTTRKLGQAE